MANLFGGKVMVVGIKVSFFYCWLIKDVSSN